MKMSLLEGGVRGSVVLFSPLMEKNSYINDNLMHITDLYPTLYSAAGGDLEKVGRIDGVNQWETINYDKPSNRTEILLNIDELQNYSAFLGYNGRYKLINGELLI